MRLIPIIVVAALASHAAAQQAVVIGGVEYRKMDSRAATEARMMSLLFPDSVTWGDWHMLAPFPYAGHGKDDLRTVLAPESDLAKMAAGGPGPDLGAVYRGKLGTDAEWKSVGDISNHSCQFNNFGDPQLDNNAVGYLYTTVTATKDTALDVTMGSDDGLRFWLNGMLLVDADVPRGLDPEAHHLRLHLRAGVNHVLAKVSQGAGGWEYQINTRAPMDPLVDAQLRYYLDLDFPATPEDEYYRAITIPVPEDVVLEVGGLDVMPDGRPAVCTRRGDVFIVDGAYDDPPVAVRFNRFASGLHEPLGLAVRQEDGHTSVYCVQRGELTRLVDETGDGVADRYDSVSSGWGVSGNYHEFAFGPKFDAAGRAWVTLNVGFCDALGKSVVPYRGWAVTVDTATGRMTPICGGLRSPNGIGQWTDGSVFYLDNQGDYVGTNRMMLMAPGEWAGHPSGLRWRPGYNEGDPDPQRQRATIWFPYKKMGQSAADFLLQNGDRFGPWDGQVFVGDQTLCSVMRVDLEVVDGFHQGVCFPFRSGLDCGVNRLAWGRDGSMFVGQTDRGWGSIGRLRYGLQRIVPTGKQAFEVRTMKAAAGGFTLTFTKDVDPATAADPASYAMSSYTYEYHATYGSPEMEGRRLSISSAEVADARTVRLHVEGLRSGGEGYVHELTLTGVRDAAGSPLLHPVAYYTMQKAVPVTAAR
ncbi:MAG: hypothetical protein IT437_12045 [Phycisphaerales bacterium]|nr:hypothetical protein [Phycisphaerales bacterium]